MTYKLSYLVVWQTFVFSPSAALAQIVSSLQYSIPDLDDSKEENKDVQLQTNSKSILSPQLLYLWVRDELKVGTHRDEYWHHIDDGKDSFFWVRH